MNDKFMRCSVANVNTGEYPKEDNAWLFAGGTLCGYVLIDGTERVSAYNWGWIKFNRPSDLAPSTESYQQNQS
jgi:hypothetical protein